MGLNRTETLSRLKFLQDQVHQTAERAEHLPQQLPPGIRAESLNYQEDLARLRREYNRLAAGAVKQGLITPGDLQAQRLPGRMGDS